MKRNLTRGITSVALAAAASFAISAPAIASTSDGAPAGDDDPAIVDRPDTSGLENTWTFAPLGVSVFGLIDSVADVPEKLLPDGSGF